MNNILEELWYGNITPFEQCLKDNKQIKELTGYISRHRDDLEATLTDKQKEILAKLDDCYDELISISEREIFIYGLKLGAGMTAEIISFKL
jgi:hypothetical protein